MSFAVAVAVAVAIGGRQLRRKKITYLKPTKHVVVGLSRARLPLMPYSPQRS